jgi:signal transduction histidine kinase/CheY-like chemotaxis protein/sensor domain CHASE-containing protein
MTLNLHRISISKAIALSCAFISALLGFTIILAWHLKWHAIIQWLPNSSPMSYNVALGFLAAGLGLACSFFSGPKSFFQYFVILLGIFLVLLGGLSFTENFYNYDFKIDQLLMKVHGSFNSVTNSTFIARPSEPTSLLFILTGIGILCTTFIRNNKIFFWLDVCLISLIFTASGCVLLGYLININAAYSWNIPNYMATNTALGFMIIGIGLGSTVLHVSHQNNIQNEKWVPLVSFLVSFAITSMLWVSLLIQDQSNMKTTLEEKVAFMKNTIEIALDDHVYHIKDLADQWHEGENSPSKAWQELSDEYLNQHKDKQIMVYLDENFIIKHIEPQDLRNSAVNLDIKTLKNSFIGHKNGKFSTILAMPEAFNNKKLSIWEPIYWQDKFVGSILDLLDIKSLIEETVIKPYSLSSMAVNILINDQNVYYSMPHETEEGFYFLTAKDDFLGLNWEIRLGYPTSIFSHIGIRNLPNAILASGFLFSLLFSLTVHFSYISRRKNLALEEAKSSLLQAQKIAKMGSWVLDLKTQKITCSSEMLSILRLHARSNCLTMDEYLKFFSTHDGEQFKTLINALNTEKSFFSIVHKLVRTDEQELIIRLDANVSKFYKDAPMEITGIFQDITEQRKLAMELQQAQKMEVLGQLTGGLAHDFNNLLMVIRGNLELMNEELSGNAKQIHRIGCALQAIARGSELIKRLLSFSRRQTLREQTIRFQETIPEFLNLVKPTLGESITIATSLPEDLWPVMVDIAQFETTLLNLAVNARDAMAGSGKLSLDFKNVEVKKTVTLGRETIKPGEYVNILVTDTGCGMRDEVLQRIFEPFFTTKEVGKGTGLGLPMVYGFIKQSQGYIHVASTVGQGTTINLYLPKGSLEKKEDLRTYSEPKNIEGKETILLIEDEEALLEMTQEYLEHLGYNVIVARNGMDALDIFKETKNINLLLTDVIMPGELTGPKLAMQARQIDPHLKVLFVTGYPRSALSEQNIQIGSFEILNKPYSMQELAKMIRKVLST